MKYDLVLKASHVTSTSIDKCLYCLGRNQLCVSSPIPSVTTIDREETVMLWVFFSRNVIKAVMILVGVEIQYVRSQEKRKNGTSKSNTKWMLDTSNIIHFKHFLSIQINILNVVVTLKVIFHIYNLDDKMLWGNEITARDDVVKIGWRGKWWYISRARGLFYVLYGSQSIKNMFRLQQIYGPSKDSNEIGPNVVSRQLSFLAEEILLLIYWQRDKLMYSKQG